MEPNQRTNNRPDVVANAQDDVVFTNKLRASKGMIAALVCAAILAVGGIGFGVWAMIDGNTKEARLNEEISRLRRRLEDLEGNGGDEDGEVVTGNWYGKPGSVDDLKYIAISYNGGRDHVNVTEERVDYFTYDDEGNLVGASLNEMKTDTSEIRKYVFDNVLDYLTEYTTSGEHDWSVTVDGPGTTCMLFGEGEHPKWLEDLLARLNVSEYGNYSKK